MKALQVSAEWKPREGYEPTEREKRDKRAIMEAICSAIPSLS